MALDSKRYFSNAVVGVPQVGADIDITQVDATPRYAVGFGFTRSDGNKYRYGYSSGGTAAGLVVAPTFASAGLATLDNSVVAPASAVAVAGDAMKPGLIGSRFLEVTSATKTAGQFKGGYLVIEDGSGKGFSYRIKNNTATDDPATSNIRIELYEPLKANLSTDTDLTITPNLWNDVTAADTVTNVMSAGVSAGTTTTAKPYGWFCTKGQIGVLQSGTVVLGQGVMLAVTPATAGSITTFGGTHTTLANILGMAMIGICMAVGAAGEYATVNIDLE